MPPKSDSNKLVVGLGELLWDILPDGKKPGGAPANFAFHTKAFGANAKIISAVGSDIYGNEILKYLKRKSFDTAFIQVTEHKTGTVDVVLDEQKHPDYVIHEQVAWDHIQLNEKINNLAHHCNAVCFGTLAQRNSITYETIHEFLQNTSVDTIKVFDINLRQNHYSKQIIEESLLASNAFKLNDNELERLKALFGLSSIDEVALKELLCRFELDIIALTKGSKGSTMMNKNTIHHSDGFSLKAKDTVGAGDSFTAVMVMGMLCNASIENINTLAGKIAAYVCTQDGATPTLPDEMICHVNEIFNKE